MLDAARGDGLPRSAFALELNECDALRAVSVALQQLDVLNLTELILEEQLNVVLIGFEGEAFDDNLAWQRRARVLMTVLRGVALRRLLLRGVPRALLVPSVRVAILVARARVVRRAVTALFQA